MDETQTAKTQENHIDFYNRSYTPPAYDFLACKRKLMMDFRQIFAVDIAEVLMFHAGQYAKAHRTLTRLQDTMGRVSVVTNMLNSRLAPSIKITATNDHGQIRQFAVRKMSAERKCIHLYSDVYDALKQEVDFVISQKAYDEQARLHSAQKALIEEHADQSQSIECSCCYSDTEFESMAQCQEGHLVCVNCLNMYTKEAIFGSGKIMLNCMASDCTSYYPQSELERCLPLATWAKLEERTVFENINMACLENLVKCPHCDFAAELSPPAKAFTCQRASCQKITCRDCGSDWEDHEGLLCSAVEKRDETSLRKEYEEKMTVAKVRTCISCKAQFTKEDGCNKMTCRCGATMCYICRTPKISYNHFCRHPLDPGKPCTKCTACSLWTNPEEDEERAIEEMKAEAREKRKAMGYEDEKVIGAPSPVKRMKLDVHGQGQEPQPPPLHLVAQEIRPFDPQVGQIVIL